MTNCETPPHAMGYCHLTTTIKGLPDCMPNCMLAQRNDYISLHSRTCLAGRALRVHSAWPEQVLLFLRGED